MGVLAQSSPVEFVLTFVFEVLTDLAFIPALAVMASNRRHFELFIGIFQLISGFLYNFCDALDTSVVLTELQWHGLNNILTTTCATPMWRHTRHSPPPTPLYPRYPRAARTRRPPLVRTMATAGCPAHGRAHGRAHGSLGRICGLGRI